MTSQFPADMAEFRAHYPQEAVPVAASAGQGEDNEAGRGL